jgi:hypothetical protein
LGNSHNRTVLACNTCGRGCNCRNCKTVKVTANSLSSASDKPEEEVYMYVLCDNCFVDLLGALNEKGKLNGKRS